MIYRSLRTLLVLVFLSATLLMQACSDDPESPEQQIRALIDQAVEAGESRSADDLVELLHHGFVDQQGRNRGELEKLLRLYFFRHKNIHLFTRIDSIELLGDNQADVGMHVAMAGSVISDVTAIASLKARVYRFDLQLVKQSEWQLRQVSWAPASISDLK